MDIWKTQKETLTTDDIEEYIRKFELERLPLLDKLYQYQLGKNVTILTRQKPDENNPDNKTPVPYGRKLVTTFTGYAYRPGYITYKEDDDGNEQDMAQLQDTFDLNIETVKTSRNGKNTGVYGLAYDLMYIDSIGAGLTRKTEPRFFPVDPREIILLYDYSSEPKKQIGIRYYKITDDHIKVEVYYKTNIEHYDRKRQDDGIWKYTSAGDFPNFYGDVPIVAYYMGDEIMGIIEPVLPLIDDYDLLLSDSLNEFDRFASAYLILKRMSLVSPELKKEAESYSRALRLLRRRRVFENVPETGDISFLTKDIPKDFIEFMTDLIKNQIHLQSHVPDFADERFSAGGVSGIAIKRMMFDFENVVSSAEADFDIGLQERIRLINVIYTKTGRPLSPDLRVVISHKRNMPLSLAEFAETAVKMQQAGFSKYLIADIMPDDIIPNVQQELDRQDEEMKSILPDIDQTSNEDIEE